MNTASVLDKAQQLQARARTLAEGEAGEKEAERIAHRVEKTRALLADLQQAVSVARRLSALDDIDGTDLTDLDDGYPHLSRHAAAGNPSDRVFTTTWNKISAATSQVTDWVRPTWSSWSQRRIAALPEARILLLPPDERTAASNRYTELTKLANKNVPSVADIAQFASSYDLLKETLDSTPDPPEEVQGLLRQLSERPLTLNDITDAQIALLRGVGIASQIEVRRRGT